MPNRIRRQRRGRGVDATGRSIGPNRFLKLDHWILKTAAWRSLPPASRALYVEIAQRYNGGNNGEISLSVREAAHLIHVAKDTATKSFHELEAKGFIRRNVCGSFNWKLRHATTWILTEYPFLEKEATKDFARWSPENSDPGPKVGSNCPKEGTGGGRFRISGPRSGPQLGPWSRSCMVHRSQSRARIYSAMPCFFPCSAMTGMRPAGLFWREARNGRVL